MGYELLENDLTDSTLWMCRSKDAKILAITILSKCNGSDRVYAPPVTLIERARLTPDEGAAAMAELKAPDPNSKCRLEQGRFIVEKEDEDGNRYLWLPSYAGRRRKYLARERKRLQRQRDEDGSRTVTPSHDASEQVTHGHVVTRGHKVSRVDQIRSEPEPDQKQIRTEREEVGIALSALARPRSGPIFECAGVPDSWQADDDLLADLKRLYPAVDIARELDLAAAKIRARAVSKKTAKGMPKFLHAWMAREQNSARPASGNGHQPARVPGAPSRPPGITFAEDGSWLTFGGQRYDRHPDFIQRGIAGWYHSAADGIGEGGGIRLDGSNPMNRPKWNRKQYVEFFRKNQIPGISEKALVDVEAAGDIPT